MAAMNGVQARKSSQMCRSDQEFLIQQQQAQKLDWSVNVISTSDSTDFIFTWQSAFSIKRHKYIFLKEIDQNKTLDFFF